MNKKIKINETEYLLSNKANKKHIDKSLKEIESRKDLIFKNFRGLNINKELPFKVPNDKTIKAIKELENGDVKKVTLDEMQNMINV